MSGVTSSCRDLKGFGVKCLMHGSNKEIPNRKGRRKSPSVVLRTLPTGVT